MLRFSGLYQAGVARMIENVNLVTAGHRPHKGEERARGLSDQVKFRYDFVRRYFANQDKISQWEDASNIPEEYKLGRVISAHWNKYCRQVVETLQAKLDLVKICINLPSTVNYKVSGPDTLLAVANDIRDAINCISQIVDHDELKGDDTKLMTFGDSANSNFNDLLKQNVEELLSFCQNSIEHGNIIRKIQSLYFLLFVIHLPEVKERAGSQFLEQYHDYIEQYISQIDDSSILDSTQRALLNLRVDYKDSTCKILATLIFDKLAIKSQKSSNSGKQAEYESISKFLQTGVIDLSVSHINTFYESIRVRCSVIVPFTVFMTDRATYELKNRHRLKVAKLDFDGFTLGEYLSQLVPN